MDNKLGVVTFNPAQRMAEKAEQNNWQEDTDKVEMDMSDLSDIADGFNLIRKGMKMISDATGVDLESA